MKKTICVTQEDIDKGKPHRTCECPVALALIRQVGNLRCVGSSYIEMDYRKYYTPDIVQDFIFLFDRNIPVHPFTFELDI